MTAKRGIAEFEQAHGGSKIKELQRKVAVEHAKVESLAGIQNVVQIERCCDNMVRFAVTGDRHTGSLYHYPGALAGFYEHCEKEGIETVYDAGDILAGHKVYRGQEFELRDLGFEAQLARLEKDAPRNIKTKFITGNHDASFKNAAGLSVGKMIEQAVPEYEFIGEDQGRVEFQTPNGKFTLGLIHPGGGSAYALSYKPQKIIESLEGGTKPDMLVIGHFHKAEFLPSYRNVAGLQAGCFSAHAHAITENGIMPIIKVIAGMKVLTHRNRYMTVNQHLTRKYKGQWTKLCFGRISESEYLSCTSNHPVLTRRQSEAEIVWRESGQIGKGDIVFVSIAKCVICGKDIPYWSKMCNMCNPMDNELTRNKATEKRHNCKVGEIQRTSMPEKHTGHKHLVKNILPECLRLQSEGWAIIPVSGVSMPDAVGFKDGKICLFEFENLHHAQLARKQLKYNGADWLKRFPYDVQWIDCMPRKKREQCPTYNAPVGFIGVPVVDVEHIDYPERTVHNLEVEEDHSYVCQNTIVHNCFEKQTPFMARHGLAAHVGGWIIEVHVGGDHNCIKAEFIAFYK